MKLIGKTMGGWIVSMDEGEVAKIDGYTYSNTQKDKKKIEIGTVLSISDMYNSAQFILNAYTELFSEIKSVQTKTAKLIGLMGTAEEVAKETKKKGH